MRFFSVIFFTFSFLFSSSQTSSYPKDYFAPPLDIPLVLSGNFGELRPNHFHSGIDIKTQGVSGKKVLASADGYVSRIKISTSGYGKAIYISHPNGYTTVYAHLDKFNEEIEAFIKRKQYQEKSFQIELFPNGGQFRFQKGELIGYSGNSGGSLAPHLHFEIRDTKTEFPLNPLLFNFDIADSRQPIIRTVTIYPLDRNSAVNGKQTPLTFPVIKSGNSYSLKNKVTPEVSGKFGLGIETYDLLNAAENHCGVYSIDLTINSQPIYQHKIEKFSFYESRYMNAHMDYDRYMTHSRKTQRSFLLPNNRLSIYKHVKNSGIVTSVDGENYNVSYLLKDVYGNESTLNFNITGGKPVLVSNLKPTASAYFNCKEANTFQNENIIIYLPKNVLYEDLEFIFETKEPMKNATGPTFKIHDEKVPLHSYIILSIKNEDIPEHLKKKSLVVSYTEKDGLYPEGGTWKGNYIVLKTRSFGDYSIMVDTTNPVITPINLSQNENMRNKWSIMMKIEDNLSGIDSYYPTVDGKWILMEYDTKLKRITYFFDEHVPEGPHKFRLEVKDKVGNSKIYEADFVR